MRNMSFFLTTPQFLDGSKDVTRRLGWRFLLPGDRVMAVIKGQGLKPGEKIQRLGEIEITSNRRQRLEDIDAQDVLREGFPGMTPDDFVAMFCKHMGCKHKTWVNRIMFRRIRKC